MVNDRFWSKVGYAENGCWPWLAGVGARGYGVYWAGRSVSAHRYAYEEVVGPIPDGLTLDHLCGNKTCVNPTHLEPVPSRTNTLRAPHAPATINAAKTICKRGHPLTGPDADLYVTGDGRRSCRQCNHIRGRERYAASRT